MFVLVVLLTRNSVFGRVKRMNRYLSVAFFLVGSPVLKSDLPLDYYPCLMPQNLFVGYSCDCKFSNISSQYEEI